MVSLGDGSLKYRRSMQICTILEDMFRSRSNMRESSKIIPMCVVQDTH